MNNKKIKRIVTIIVTSILCLVFISIYMYSITESNKIEKITKYVDQKYNKLMDEFLNNNNGNIEDIQYLLSNKDIFMKEKYPNLYESYNTLKNKQTFYFILILVSIISFACILYKLISTIFDVFEEE